MAEELIDHEHQDLEKRIKDLENRVYDLEGQIPEADQAATENIAEEKEKETT